MIKRIIFDIDNTLIPWKEEYNQEINKALEEFKIPYTEDDAKNISKAFFEYENVYFTFEKNQMAKYINNYTYKNYPKELIERIIQRWEACVPERIDSEIIQLLEYLKQNYEMVILTDWFVSSQSQRLQKTNILQYFQKVYGAEKTKRKPFPEAFLQAIGENRPEECVIIGDDFKRDIQGAINVGTQAFWYCPKLKQTMPEMESQNMNIKEMPKKGNIDNRKSEECKYKVINKLEELKKYL